MSTLLSTFSCCFVWFLIGALLGWLLHHWLFKAKFKSNTVNQAYAPQEAPVAKAAPVAAAPVAKAAPVKAAAPVKPKPAPAAKPKPKPAAKPKQVDINLKAARAAGFKIKNVNDLTVVEGIGPKINGLFNADGVKTFAQLSKQTVPQMRKMLDKAGPRYRIANPQTWAEQAALAAANKWEALNKLQDTLDGGVRK